MAQDSQQGAVVLGDIFVDQTMQLARFPSPGDDARVERLRRGSGGSALNMAVALARLGAPAQLVGRVGAGQQGDLALQTARDAGVGLQGVQRDSRRPTGLCSVLVDQQHGQRTFLSFRGANERLDARALPRQALGRARPLLISAYALLGDAPQRAALKALDITAGAGGPVALDLGLAPVRRCREQILSLLPRLWLLSLNEAELAALLPGRTPEQAVERLLDKGSAVVALKRGPRGCRVVQRGQPLVDLPGVEVSAVDTTGCGDAFTAALCLALLSGEKLDRAATLANTMGALSATRPGAAASIPAADELRAALDPELHHLLPQS